MRSLSRDSAKPAEVMTFRKGSNTSRNEKQGMFINIASNYESEKANKSNARSILKNNSKHSISQGNNSINEKPFVSLDVLQDKSRRTSFEPKAPYFRISPRLQSPHHDGYLTKKPAITMIHEDVK